MRLIFPRDSPLSGESIKAIKGTLYVCMYVYLYIYIFIYIHIYVYIYMYMMYIQYTHMGTGTFFEGSFFANPVV